MSRIEDLIAELCPDGVEYLTVGEVSNIISPKAKVKSNDYLKNGKYPVIDQGQQFIGGYTNEDGAFSESEYVVFGDHTCTIKFIDFEFVQGADGIKVIKAKPNIIPRYLYHAMSNIKLESGYARHWSKMKAKLIPVPPLEVQREIVRILDSFAELQSELQSELQARKKQYEYYRDMLLSFDGESIIPSIQKMISKYSPGFVKHYELSELFITRNGYTPSKSKTEYWENGTIPWFRMDDIREKGQILSSSSLSVSRCAVKGEPFPEDSIIVATSATIGEHALITVPSLANQRFTYLILKENYKDQIDIKFIYYYCFKLDEYCKMNLHKGNFASVDMTRFNKFKFSIPPLEVQQCIVSILDRFDALCNDLTSGIPAEIEARQQQYEYYRDKLLNFKRKRAGA